MSTRGLSGTSPLTPTRRWFVVVCYSVYVSALVLSCNALSTMLHIISNGQARSPELAGHRPPRVAAGARLMDEAQGLCAEGGHFGACTPVHVYVRAWRGGADLRGLGGRVANPPSCRSVPYGARSYGSRVCVLMSDSSSSLLRFDMAYVEYWDSSLQPQGGVCSAYFRLQILGPGVGSACDQERAVEMRCGKIRVTACGTPLWRWVRLRVHWQVMGRYYWSLLQFLILLLFFLMPTTGVGRRARCWRQDVTGGAAGRSYSRALPCNRAKLHDCGSANVFGCNSADIMIIFIPIVGVVIVALRSDEKTFLDNSRTILPDNCRTIAGKARKTTNIAGKSKNPLLQSMNLVNYYIGTAPT